jgi:hypothetical protein
MLLALGVGRAELVGAQSQHLDPGMQVSEVTGEDKWDLFPRGFSRSAIRRSSLSLALQLGAGLKRVLPTGCPPYESAVVRLL